MARAYRVREIAVRPGLSETTVDRVLNGRGGVRASTAQTVHQAIDDLDRQRTQVRLGGRTFVIDLVMQAPARFSGRRPHGPGRRAARPAPRRHPGPVRTCARPRPVAESSRPWTACAAAARRACILKAPDEPEVGEAVDRLVAAGIPVVTLVTDLPTQPAARLRRHRQPGGGRDRGVPHRAVARRRARRRARHAEPQRVPRRGRTRDGLPGDAAGPRAGRSWSHRHRRPRHDHARRSAPRSPRHPAINAVYSIGGGNRADPRRVRRPRPECRVFVAHDLDADNLALLRAGRISAVLHHDLGQDMRRACHVIMQAHRALPGGILSWPSSIQVVTPFNAPQPPPPEHR